MVVLAIQKIIHPYIINQHLLLVSWTHHLHSQINNYYVITLDKGDPVKPNYYNHLTSQKNLDNKQTD